MQVSKKKLYINKWWAGLILAAVFLGLSYGFVSLAIDSGSWWHYGLAFLFFIWGLNRLIYVIRRAFGR